MHLSLVWLMMALRQYATTFDGYILIPLAIENRSTITDEDIDIFIKVETENVEIILPSEKLINPDMIGLEGLIYEEDILKSLLMMSETADITDCEREFLSLKQCSVRNIRNLFAHANLMAINIVQEENGRDIYYPLSENESCLLLYKLISALVFNVLLDVVKSNILLSVSDELEELLLNYNIKIVELTAEETLKLQGMAETDILKMNTFVDENTMMRLADNGSNVDVLAEIFKGLV